MKVFPIENIQKRLDELKELYPFSSDTDFMSKLKLFFSETDTARRTGRTHALARISLETAIETENPVYIIDHFKMQNNSHQMDSHFMRAVEDWQGYYHDMGVNIILRHEANYGRFSAKFEPSNLTQSVEIYNLLRLKNYCFPKEQPKEFSKLLLIVN